MNLIKAYRLELLLTSYRSDAVAYWEAVEKLDYGEDGWMVGPDAPQWRDTDASLQLRTKIQRSSTAAARAAHELGVSVGGVSVPAPMIGGMTSPFNLLMCVCDTWVGHQHVGTQEVLDAIDRCIGAAQEAKRRAFWRLVNPLWWFIDIPALVVSIPFRIAREAGVPASVVQSGAAKAVEVGAKAVLSAGTIITAVVKILPWLISLFT